MRYQHPDTAALRARLEAARTTGKILMTRFTSRSNDFHGAC